MSRFITILCLIHFLTACSMFTTTANSEESYARCKEIKRQLLFQYATNDERIATQRAGEIDNLNRAYRENGCN